MEIYIMPFNLIKNDETENGISIFYCIFMRKVKDSRNENFLIFRRKGGYLFFPANFY